MQAMNLATGIVLRLHQWMHAQGAETGVKAMSKTLYAACLQGLPYLLAYADTRNGLNLPVS